MSEQSTDDPPKHDAPAIAKRIIRWTKRRFGSRWAKLAAYLVVIGPLIWSSREEIQTSIESIKKAHDGWRRNHPQVPEVKPGRFVIGILVDQNGHADESTLHAFQSEYWRHPLIEFARVDVPELPDFAFDRVRVEQEESAVAKWVRDSGASGAIWGNIATLNGQGIAFLQWTGPEFSDAPASSFARVIHKSTLPFPRIRVKDMYGFLRIWIKGQARLHYENSLAIGVNDLERQDEADISAFRSVADNSCDTDMFSSDCKRLADIQIELFLADTWNERLWTSEEDKNKFYSCCYYYNSTGKDATDASPVVQTPEDFRHLFRQLDFLLALAQQASDDSVTDQYVCRAQIVIAVVRFDRVDVTVRKEYPNFRNLLILTKALVDFTAINSRLSKPVAPPSSSGVFEHVCTQDPPTWAGMSRALDAFQNALSSAVKSSEASKYQLGVWSNQLATMYANAALAKAAPASERPKLWNASIEAGTSATKFLDRYKIRIPRYVTDTYLGLASILQLAGGTENARREERISQLAMRIAEQYDLSGLAHEAALAHSIALGRQASANRDVEAMCRSVHEWFEADRFTRSTPTIQLRPDEDEDDFIRNMKLFHDIDRASYQSCLRSAGADVNAINDSIHDLTLRSTKN